jgi:membrane protease YdiL (CAAX protease family)
VPSQSKLWSRDLIELAICFGLIQLVMWTPRPSQRFLFWIAFAWIVITTIVRRPNAGTLGLRIPSLRSFLWIVCGGVFVAGALVLVALALRTLHPLKGAEPLGLHLAGYLLWAFEQQFILQDYFLLRLLSILPDESGAVIAAAVLFSAAHLPNPVLVVATFVFGLVACKLFLRHRNLYALGLVHGILGLCVAISVPDAITHHMTVGLGYLHYHH